ncbi:MAG: hypothetical protein ACI4SH_05965, partial [Candidatus Scatosoma sp.]
MTDILYNRSPIATEKRGACVSETEGSVEKIYILQPVTEDNEKDVPSLIEEAKALIESAGAAVAGCSAQKLRTVSPATVFGAGKLSEIAASLDGLEVSVLYNSDLSPS